MLSVALRSKSEIKIIIIMMMMMSRPGMLCESCWVEQVRTDYVENFNVN